MNVRIDELAPAGWAVRALLTGTLVAALLGAGLLVRATVVAGGVDHVAAIQVRNQTRLTLQLDAIGDDGGRIGLGAHPPGASDVEQVVDLGPAWTFVVSYGGSGVHRETVRRADLAARGWTVTIPSGATADLERAGFR